MTQRIDHALIYPNPDQPRKTFDAQLLGELADSILENGLIQPITVRPDGAGRYMIVAGERRWRAFGILIDDGIEITDVPANVIEVEDMALDIAAIIENDQRVDVAPLEQAHSYQRMMEVYGLDVDQLAKKLGKPKWRIEERTNLLKLSATTQQLLKAGALTSGHAWYLVQLDDRKQNQLIRAINAGQCPTTSALKAVFEAIRDADAQSALFAMEPEPTVEDRKAARTFEQRIESVAALLRASIVDNEIVALKRVSRQKLGETADLLKAMQIDISRLEIALRVQAAGAAIAQEA